MTATANYSQSQTDHRIAVVRLPLACDVTNDRVVLDALAAALTGRPSVVVADATGTAHCDCAGVSALVRAHHQAAAAGAQLRLAASLQVQRVITLTRAHEVLDFYPTVDEALADITDASATDGADPAAKAADETGVPHEHSGQPGD